MKKFFLEAFLITITFFLIYGCMSKTPRLGNHSILPLQKVNWQIILEQQKGLEIFWEDAKDLRDFYRGGVQQKAEADKKFLEGAYKAALELYKYSNEFFSTVLNHLDQDSAEFVLYEGNSILFFPNLLMAENYFKVGKILKMKGSHWSARRHWKQALSYIKKSIESAPTQWGLSLEKELNSLLASE